jgi:signal transduction histidine kinase
LENALERDGTTDRAALHRALERGRGVEAIIDDLLELTRPGSPNSSLLGDVLRDTEDRWHGAVADRGRRLVVRPPDHVTRIAASAPALRQILDVLLDNALLHGSGTITVQTEEIADGVSVTVKDEGTTMRERAASDTVGGLGLPLAESLATSAGALLQVPAPGGPPVFRLLIPTAEEGQTAESYR